MIPTKAKVFRNTIEVEVEVADVVPGDVVVLDERARVRLIRELWMVIGKTGFIP